jgi:hypothetical protein
MKTHLENTRGRATCDETLPLRRLSRRVADVTCRKCLRCVRIGSVEVQTILAWPENATTGD